MKTCLLLNLCIFSLFIAVSCTHAAGDSSPSIEPSSQAYSNIVVAFLPPQGLGDGSDVDDFYAGLCAACLEADNQLGMIDVLQNSWDNTRECIESYLQYVQRVKAEATETPDFLFLFYEGYLPYVEALQNEFEKANVAVFLFESKKNDLAFAKTISIPLYGASFLAGCAAKKLLSGKEHPRLLSILANSSDQSLQDGLAGFAAGYEPSPAWDGTIFEGWNEAQNTLDFSAMALLSGLADGGYNQAPAMYLFITAFCSVYDLIFPLCRGSSNGFIRLNREKGEASPYTVGTYQNLNAISSQVPFSVVKHTGRVVKECVLRWLHGEEIVPNMEFGLKDGYTALVVSKPYEEALLGVVEENMQRAIELEREYEDAK